MSSPVTQLPDVEPGRRGRVRLLAAGRLLQAPKPIAWLVRDHLEQNCVALLIGAPAAGKSFAAIDMACCIATGTPWQGQPVSQGPVFFVLGEGHNGFRRRLMAWEVTHEAGLADAPLYITQRAVTLTDDEAAQDLSEAIQSLREQSGADPALIIVDTVARAFRGDENAASDMARFLASVDEVRGHWRASVLLVHHTGHGAEDRARGSSALRGAVDWEYLVKREDNTIALSCTKAKDAAAPATRHFELQQVELPWEDDEGKPQTSAVLHATSAPTAAPKVRGLGERQQKALEALEQLAERQGDNLARAGHPRDQARVSIEDWKDACGFTDRRYFAKAKDSLLDRGLIELDHPYVRLLERHRVGASPVVTPLKGGDDNR